MNQVIEKFKSLGLFGQILFALLTISFIGLLVTVTASGGQFLLLITFLYLPLFILFFIPNLIIRTILKITVIVTTIVYCFWVGIIIGFSCIVRCSNSYSVSAPLLLSFIAIYLISAVFLIFKK